MQASDRQGVDLKKIIQDCRISIPNEADEMHDLQTGVYDAKQIQLPKSKRPGTNESTRVLNERWYNKALNQVIPLSSSFSRLTGYG